MSQLPRQHRRQGYLKDELDDANDWNGVDDGGLHDAVAEEERMLQHTLEISLVEEYGENGLNIPLSPTTLPLEQFQDAVCIERERRKLAPVKTGEVRVLRLRGDGSVAFESPDVNSSWEWLCDELLLEIFRRLVGRDVALVMQVCFNWRRVASDWLLWHGIFERENLMLPRKDRIGCFITKPTSSDIDEWRFFQKKKCRKRPREYIGKEPRGIHGCLVRDEFHLYLLNGEIGPIAGQDRFNAALAAEISAEMHSVKEQREFGFPGCQKIVRLPPASPLYSSHLVAYGRMLDFYLIPLCDTSPPNVDLGAMTDDELEGIVKVPPGTVRFAGHVSGFTALAVSPDGLLCVTIGSTAHARVWKIAPEAEIEASWTMLEERAPLRTVKLDGVIDSEIVRWMANIERCLACDADKVFLVCGCEVAVFSLSSGERVHSINLDERVLSIEMWEEFLVCVCGEDSFSVMRLYDRSSFECVLEIETRMKGQLQFFMFRLSPLHVQEGILLHADDNFVFDEDILWFGIVSEFGSSMWGTFGSRQKRSGGIAMRLISTSYQEREEMLRNVCSVLVRDGVVDPDGVGWSRARFTRVSCYFKEERLLVRSLFGTEGDQKCVLSRASEEYCVFDKQKVCVSVRDDKVTVIDRRRQGPIRRFVRMQRERRLEQERRRDERLRQETRLAGEESQGPVEEELKVERRHATRVHVDRSRGKKVRSRQIASDRAAKRDG